MKLVACATLDVTEAARLLRRADGLGTTIGAPVPLVEREPMR